MKRSEDAASQISTEWPGTTGWFSRCEALGSVAPQTRVARWANRFLILFLLLFAISVPHSIAISQASASLSLIAWIARDFATRRFHFVHTPIDLPLLAFALLTVLSSLFSFEPSISLPKLKGLLLFGVIYLLAANVNKRGVWLIAVLLAGSSLIGVGFSLMEKAWGRGMVVASIAADSPLAGSKLQPGDVIWMIARRRVYSPDEAAMVLRGRRTGETVNIETLHEGDPVEVTLAVTDDLKTKANPLGITASGRSRRFRVSGFSRQFLTYAEQMQIMALLAYGGLLTGVQLWRRQTREARVWLFGLLFALFSLALALTASRAVIASLIAAILLVSMGVGGRLVRMIALAAVLSLAALGVYAITSARQTSTINFADDSAMRRVSYMQSGLRVIPQHPLLGVGMDAHKRHWREWGFPGDYITHTHSTPIQIAMDRGLPALGCYIWLMAAMLLMLWRGYKRAQKSEGSLDEGLLLGAFGAVIGFSISSLTNYNFGDSEALMLLLSIVGLGVVANQYRERY